MDFSADENSTSLFWKYFKTCVEIVNFPNLSFGDIFG